MAKAGGFIWYELMTPDPDAAKRFYDDVVGWSIDAQPAGEMDYRMIARSDGGLVGGVLRLSDEMSAHGTTPRWTGYLHVDDTDEEVARIKDDGGHVLLNPITMDGVGRIAMVSDPQGALYYVMTPTPPADRPDAESDAFSADRAQHVRWNELVAPDDDAAVRYYTRHYGWTQEHSMSMGPLGDYRFIEHAGVAIGAIMKKADVMPQSGWTFYFGVNDIDRAATSVRDGGGRTMGDPQQIPGGEYSVHAFDPQGAYFALVGPREEG